MKKRSTFAHAVLNLLTLVLFSSLSLGLGAAEPHPDITAFLYGPKTKKLDPGLITDDRTFIRRIWLDLAGRLPKAATVEAFLESNDPGKRAKAVDAVMRTAAFTDRWTTFLEDLFRNRIFVQNAMFRNPFHRELRDMVARNLPWNEIAKRLLLESGTASREQSAFTFWLIEGLFEDFRLDYLDDQVSFITESMLGLQTNCISCHDGAFHLENINKGLSVMKRAQLWGMSAFLAKSFPYLPKPYEEYGAETDEETEERLLRDLQFVDLDDPSFRMGRGFILDEGYENGEYVAETEAGTGMRTPRRGGIIAPRYLSNGEGPRPDETRREALARLITSDRQFARNMVNRLWAHFFGEGFVEPLNGWDLGRLDATSAASFDTTVQARNPELMEHLTDVFIEQGYDIRAFMRFICNTHLYRSNYAAVPIPTNITGLALWQSKARVRRMEAEAVVDSVFQILDLERRYVVTGMLDEYFNSAWQMPDAYEPNPYAIYDKDEQFIVTPQSLGFANEEHFHFVQYSTMDLMRLFGAADRINGTARDDQSSTNTALGMMNTETIHYWFLGEAHSPFINQLVDDLNQGKRTERETVRFLFLSILLREPNPEETPLFLNYFKDLSPEESVPDLVWVLFNHPDFLFIR